MVPKLKRAVAASGLAQNQIADAIKQKHGISGMSQPQISALLKGGKPDVTFEQMFALADVLGLSLDFLADDAADVFGKEVLSEHEQTLIQTLRAKKIHPTKALSMILLSPRITLLTERSEAPEVDFD